VQLIFGAIKSTASGLITGQIFSSMVANTGLAKNVIAKYQLKNINWKSMKNQAIRYINFPKYSMWSILANVMSIQLINILITFYYSVATLGFYSLAQRILGLPASLIGSSIGQVYFQQATVEKNETGKAVKVFKATSKKLIILSCIFFIPLYFVLPFAFALAFGEKWMIAGVYSQIILPVFVFRFVSAALSTTNSVFEKQRLSLAWQVILLFLSLVIFFVGNFYQLDFIDFLKVYSLVISLHYVLLYVLLGLVADKRI
jgi:O-antigen/teichoic acid export membrane protein